jgi:hypothetical protein
MMQTFMMILMSGNALTLIFRLRRLIRKIPEKISVPKLDLFFDSLAVMAGSYLIAAVIDVTVAGEIDKLEYSDYAFVGLIVANVVLTIVCAVITNRRRVDL